jgi:hypothetical protein
MTMESTVQSLIVYPRNGLANRLRTLASSSIMAGYSGRKLFVNWVPSGECNIEWSELFLNPIESCSLPLSAFHIGVNLYDDSIIPMSWCKDVPRLSMPGESDTIAVHTCRNFQPEGMSNEAYAEAKSLFYRNLRPTHTVQKTVSDMQKQYFDGCDIIGIHIRRKDHLSFLKKDHRLVCPTELFIEAMETILRMNPEAKFFLATDDKREEKFIRQLFPGAVIVYEKEGGGRNTTSGMQNALVDWLLLSKTSGIIASYASSFSVEAAMVHGIKTNVIVKKEELSKNHIKHYVTTLLKTHYSILKDEGLKQYLLRSYNYRKNQISNRNRKKTREHGKDV